MQEQVVQRIGKHLHELDLEGEDPGAFIQDNAALFESIANVSGLRTIVDASKSLPRAVALCSAFDGSKSLRLSLASSPGPFGFGQQCSQDGYGYPFRFL